MWGDQSVNGVTEKTKPPEQHAGADWAQQAWLWPLEATRLALHCYAQWFADQKPAPSRAPDQQPLAWTTPNAVVLELPSMRLREFSRGPATQQPVLVCAPYALHGALIADFAPGHSLVEALQKDGVNRIYVPDWRSAVPDMRYLSIDNYLAELNVAIDEIGAPVDLVGLCQGGWLSLVYAARFPGKVRRLVLAGAPVDVSTPSELSKMVAALPHRRSSRWCSRATASSAASTCSSSGTLRSASRTWKPCCNGISATDRTRRGVLLDRFERWDRATLDLPGTYYLEVTDRVFRQNQIAKGRFVALGRRIDLAEVRVPVFLLAGERRHRRPARSGVRHRRAAGHAAGVAGTGLRAVRSPQPFHGAQRPGPFLAPDRPVASGRHRRCRRRQDQRVRRK